MKDKTIGIVVSREDNKYIVEYSSDRRIISRNYMFTYWGWDIIFFYYSYFKKVLMYDKIFGR